MVAELFIGQSKYLVYGLESKAEAISVARGRVLDLYAVVHAAATHALESWRGTTADVFAGIVNDLLMSASGLCGAAALEAARCRSFPDAPYWGPVSAYAYPSNRVSPAVSGGALSASPTALRTYATSTAERSALRALATAVTADGLSATVSTQRGLTPAEAQPYLDAGLPAFEVDSMWRWGPAVAVPVSEVFVLADLGVSAAEVERLALDAAAWATVVATALDNADRTLLELLVEYPTLARFLDGDSTNDGEMTGELALLVVLVHLDAYDTAAGRGDVDHVVGLPDLEAVAADASAPAHLRAAARYLLDNRLLLSQVSIVDTPLSYEVVNIGEHKITADGIRLFLDYNAALRTIALGFDAFDRAGDDDGDLDGVVSPAGLAALADDPEATAAQREAAQFLVDNPLLTQRLGRYGRANFDRYTLNSWAEVDMPQGSMDFGYDDVVALTIDQQAFGSDPVAANRFVMSLPMADRNGDGGLSFMLASSEGTRALANAALADGVGELGTQQATISHLPETIAGDRNRLITGFYDLLAKRADAIFAGDLTGFPTVAGHPGSNWLHMAPWASDTVGGVIRGDTTGPFGFTTSEIQQAGADGNQWIFDDIGRRYSAFIELYERSPNPTEAELERFFRQNFDEGDGTIRTGFAAYVGATQTDNPLDAQSLLFQGNVLVATHEQAGAQIYLERVSLGPDVITAHFVDAGVGGETLDMNLDIPPGPTTNNLIIPQPILSLDTGDATAEQFSRGGVVFATGGPADAGVVDLEPMSGTELSRPEFSPSTEVWILEGGGNAENPDSLAGSGASSWPDWEERMNAILRLFEQNHTSDRLFDTSRNDIPMDDVGWLDPMVSPGG
ncbi:MAG: hypothetical protein ACK5OX_14735 [Desertimonas sp.]